MFKYYNRSMAHARARVKATFGIGGVYWPETNTLFGMYSSGGQYEYSVTWFTCHTNRMVLNILT